MLKRRSFLLGLAGVTIPTAGIFTSRAFAGPASAGTLPLTVVNNSGNYANSSVQIYIVGTDLATGNQAYVKPDGTLARVSLSDNGPDGYTDYSIPLAASGDTRLTLPNMSGRIYVALGDKLKFKVVTDGAGRPALQYPAGWVSSDPNYQVLHDFSEFTFNSGGMYCNTTAVDQFSIPLALRLTGAADQTTGTIRQGGRDAVFSAVAAAPGFDKLVVGNKLRVIAPGHGLDSGLFSSSYYDSYVNQVWDTYRSTDLRVTVNSGTFTGRVSGDTLTFNGPRSVSFSRPSTRDVLYCDGALAAPNDGTTGPVAAVLGAGFNRSVLAAQHTQPVTDPGAFYTVDTTNHYAKAVHSATVDGKAYGFAFDDVAGFASYIQDSAPTGLTLTLTPW
ncbi:glycoside hydrolase family 64 protein [Streptomyces sp. RPT161]|uniref:glycoside hydrolase family 64 protein n=1 Tax=Streptomyces sp. RPT161 TaxID=3015993 RepID=UPI0022B8E6D6|nr:glycoside hydrolase family 64 protein [Streptomyces sp. RPT161]